MMSTPAPVVAGALVSALVCALLVCTQRFHGHLSMDSAAGVQKFHVHPTPRIGGLGLLLGLVVICFVSEADQQALLAPMLWASIPAFVFGLAEDLTKAVGPRARLLATMGSGVLATWLTGVSLHTTGLPWVDALLAWAPLAVLFTAVAVGGVANAVNIVDGFNGLASGLVTIAALGLAAIAWQVGDTTLAYVVLAVVASVLGFMLLNFPWGKIFLGDGGAYVLGFWLAWLAVLLMDRNPSVTPAAVLLVCAYPVLEVLFSILRRMKRASSPMEPDRLHLHSLVKVRLTRKLMPHASRRAQNAAVSPFVWCVAAVPAALGAWLWPTAVGSYLGLAAFVALYVVVYRRLALFGWR